MKYDSLNIQKLFLKSFDKYIEKGYVKVLTEVNFYDSKDLDSIRIQLKNEKINREFSFRFQTYNGYDKAFIAELVWFSIDKEGCDNRLRINDYWRRIKGDDNHIPFSLKSIENSNTLEMRLLDYFDIIKMTLDKELKSVVDGNEWIDLPFDFYPYK